MNQKLFAAISQGFQLVPMFIFGVETLIGKKNGATKKDAVTMLVNASIAGTALGLDAAGETETAQTVATMQPAISSLIDQTVAIFNRFGWKAGGRLNTPSPAIVPLPIAPPKDIPAAAQAATTAPQAGVANDSGFQH